MMKKTIFAVMFSLCSLAVVAPASAQHRTTVVLRSGERLTGELIDYGARGFSMRINGANRDIAAADVANIEFSGRPLTANERARANTGQPFVVLNDGQLIEGRLYDIGGTSPLRITIDTNSGQRDFNSSDVSVISLARTLDAVATSGPPPAQAPPAGALIVAGNQRWTPTNITVRSGETLRFRTTGEVRLSGDPNDRAQAAGSFSQKYAPGGPLPSVYAGALIGRINRGRPFAIGDQPAVRMPAGGTLDLGINDDNVSDNSGQFQVVISR